MGLKESLKELQKNEKLSIKREVKKELTRLKREKLLEKKCVICNSENAKYYLKGSTKGYCKECALEHFSDLKCLERKNI